MEKRIKTAVIRTRVEDTLKDRFNSICKAYAINQSELLRQLIEHWCIEQEQHYTRRITDNK